jgi:putative DNA primase/helicase
MWGACLSSDLYALFLEWCSRGKEGSISHTRFAEFISADVPKTERGIPWTDGNNRKFGIFFFPDDDKASLPPSFKSADLGRCVTEWRAAAKLAGWNVEAWDHVKAVAA